MIQFTKERPLRVFEAFAGYGSQSLALDRLKKNHPNFFYQPVGFSEIEPNAIKAYHMIHGEHIKNYGDISKIDWNDVPDFDFFTYSSPCQDFSNAGLQKGGEEGSGTRSSLLWECRRAIVAKKPMFLMLENVKALVGKKFLPLLQKWCDELNEYGYINYWKVLDASVYGGIPQHRERVFLISIRKDIATMYKYGYKFPKPIPLETEVKDILQPKEEVDEKYYLSESAIKEYRKKLYENGKK